MPDTFVQWIRARVDGGIPVHDFVLEQRHAMLAYRLLEAQTQPAFQDVPDPHAGPGQVVVRVAGSGLCHTDFTVIGRDRTSCLPCHQAIKTRDFIFSTYTR